MHEQDSTFTNQRADNDLMHSRIKARTSDKRTSAHAAERAVVPALGCHSADAGRAEPAFATVPFASREGRV